MPASYTSGQFSNPRRHPTCWASLQRSHTVSSTPCHGAWTTAPPSTHQRWPESLFQTLTALLFQNFGIWVQIRQFFKYENPTPVQTPAAIINPTLIYPCFYLWNDYTDSCCCRKWKVTLDPGPVFPDFSLRSEGKTQNPARVDYDYPDLVPPLALTRPSRVNTWRLKSRHPFVPAAQHLISSCDNNNICEA